MAPSSSETTDAPKTVDWDQQTATAESQPHTVARFPTPRPGEKLDHEEPDAISLSGALEAPAVISWVSGWRLAAIVIGSGLALFMVQTESSVTSTAITTITDDLGQFDKSPWVFTAYLLTYSGFPILSGKISDILGRKQVLLGCITLFVVFSGACGAAQSMLQLIMFRWLKGLGAGGIYAICTGYGFELCPPEKWPAYSSYMAISAAISLASSPLIGAAVSDAGQWRWCFLLNVPIGATAVVLLVLGMPKKLRLEPASKPELSQGPGRHKARLNRLKRLDYPGTILFVGAAVFLLTALQQVATGTKAANGSSTSEWTSPEVLALLVLAPIFLVAFICWQWCIAKYKWESKLDPILSWDILTNRVFMAALANAWLSGMVMMVSIVQIPQRFMLVNRISAIDAGVRLLPFAAVMCVASLAVAMISTRTKRGVHVVFALVLGGVLQVAGTAGLSQTSNDLAIDASRYGFQVLAAVGVGIFNYVLILLTPLAVDKKHLGVGNGAVNQFRILGCSLGLSIVTCATVPTLRSDLLTILTPEQTALVMDRTERIFALPPDKQELVRHMFGKMYNTQMYILIGIAAAQVFMPLLMWKRKPLVLRKDIDLSE